MGKVHRFPGLTVGAVLNDMKNDERRQQHGAREHSLYNYQQRTWPDYLTT